MDTDKRCIETLIRFYTSSRVENVLHAQKQCGIFVSNACMRFLEKFNTKASHLYCCHIYERQMNVGEEIPARCLGETGALSFKKPTEQDLKDTQELEASLAQLNIFETQEEISQRREALVRLQEISNGWIRQKALEQNLPTHVANSTTGKIFTFGSYRLGVNFRGADIDSLLVVPRFITREEFFSDFQTVLAENPNVEDLHAVVDAFVPVLKMKFMGVEIDLLFAQIDQMSIPENFSLCENTEVLMRNMDERDVRSINGVRVTEDILNLVYNKNSFKVALKVIRIWAKRRNVYSNALGFLGGVSWAILVSRICQLYPYATPSMIVYLFFTIFSQWPWPKPVRLRESEYIASLCLPVWDPRLNPSDQYHLMPILTPSYPSQNSTYNVQRSNRIIIERELKQGRFRHNLLFLYLNLLRVLVSNFEVNRYVKMAHINCRAYGKGPNDDDANFVRKWFIGMEFDRNTNSLTSTVHNSNTAGEKPTLNVDLSENISSFEKSIERGLSSEDLSVTVKYVKKSQLAQFISAEDMDEIKRQAAAAALSNVNNSTENLKGVRQLPSNNALSTMSSPASSIELSTSEEASSPSNRLQNSVSTSSLISLATANSSSDLKCPPSSPISTCSSLCDAVASDVQLNESSHTSNNHKHDSIKDRRSLPSDHSPCNNTLKTSDSPGRLTPKRVGSVDPSLETSSDIHCRSITEPQVHDSEDFRKRARISSENARPVVFTSSAQ
ncbi:Poly(A) polymerase gamma [Schistosoma japonicum]|nr:Poly(A) polymerase gamma [Schistosoma japonicum]KAH8862356.1 Poly(A) polymerase gamma [Schistosoma japonicum]KAH8862357.1 Poly(A) polymerase gamma [Schistosoma japonicum]KAH8862358.1 Poly(A) polymerase gamma [Schistosoma japonicum]